MKTEKKIFLDAGDSLRTVLKEIKKTSSDRIVLHVPENAEIGSDLENFHEIEKAAKKLKKEVVIESVDKDILGFAEATRLSAQNPVFKGKEKAAMSDILPTPKKGTSRAKLLERIEQKQKSDEAPEIFEEEEEESQETPSVVHFTEKKARVKKAKKRRRKSLGRRQVYILGGIVFVVVLFAVILFFALPQAEITLTMKKINVDISETVFVSDEVTTPAYSTNSVTVPGEFLSAQKNFAMQFDASETRSVEKKAEGILTIYNAFSSRPQRLVATTRFESPDGKIFRIPEAIVIPAAEADGDDIVPASIDVKVFADSVGEDYNLPAGLRWTIPGFAGTSRFTGFYAENKGEMQGGFSGEKLYPSDEEIETAEETVENSLRNLLKTELLTFMTDDFKLFDETSRFEILKRDIQEDEEEPEKFVVYSEAEMEYIVFEDSTLEETLLEKAKEALPADATDVVPVDFKVLYGNPEKIDFSEGTFEFLIEGHVTFAAAVDTEQLARSLEGLDESALRREIFAIPGLENARIALWPFWVKSVPGASRVTITVE